MLDFDIGFVADTPEEKEEARKQRIANMTDEWPELVGLMTGKTWEEIYGLSMVRAKE